jgi:hypothetical protein
MTRNAPPSDPNGSWSLRARRGCGRVVRWSGGMAGGFTLYERTIITRSSGSYRTQDRRGWKQRETLETTRSRSIFPVSRLFIRSLAPWRPSYFSNPGAASAELLNLEIEGCAVGSVCVHTSFLLTGRPLCLPYWHSDQILPSYFVPTTVLRPYFVLTP